MEEKTRHLSTCEEYPFMFTPNRRHFSVTYIPCRLQYYEQYNFVSEFTLKNKKVVRSAENRQPLLHII